MDDAYGVMSGIFNWLNFERLTGRPFPSSTFELRKVLNRLKNRVPSRYIAAFLDMAEYLPDDICCKVDRASMAHSLEVRPPLLDHRIVEFANSLPFHCKYDRKQGGKLVLKKVLERYVPRELWDRPKQGFSSPIGDWFKGDLKANAAELLNPEKLHREWGFQPEYVRSLLEDHWSGRKNTAYYLWVLFALEMWRKQKFAAEK